MLPQEEPLDHQCGSILLVVEFEESHPEPLDLPLLEAQEVWVNLPVVPVWYAETESLA